MSLEFETTVFTAPQGEALAKVYVVAVPTRDVTDDELAAYRLSGNIIGPRCKYSSTLQTKIPFRHRGFTPCGYRTALLAEAVVPDPCYWSPELPFLYRAVGEVTGDVAGQQSFDQTFGIRSIGTSRNRFTLNDKVWVPRGVDRGLAPNATLAEWRDSATLMVVKDLDEALGQAASEAGVLLLASTDERGERAAEVLFRLSRYPAVVLAFVDDCDRIDPVLQTVARNTLLGRFDVDDPLPEIDATRFRLVVSSDGMTIGLPESAASGLPLLAVAEASGTQSLTDARAKCDQTQRELAARGTAAAGYIVT